MGVSKNWKKVVDGIKVIVMQKRDLVLFSQHRYFRCNNKFYGHCSPNRMGLNNVSSRDKQIK